MGAPLDRPPAAPKTRNGCLWALSLATTGIVLALHIGAPLLWRDRLPDPVAIHWSGAGVADGTGSLATHLLVGAFTLVLIGVLLPICAGSLTGAGNSGGVPLLAGLGNGLVVGLGAMFISGFAGQLGAQQALGTRMDAGVLVGGLVLAVLWALASAFLVRAASPEPTAGTGAMPTALQASTPGFAPGAVLTSFVRGPAWLLVLLAVLALGMAVWAVFAGNEGAGAVWSLVPGLLAVLLAGGVFLVGRVVADEAGIRVYGGGFLKLLHVRPGNIDIAEGRWITPAEFGGWGLRVSGAGIAFIVGAGPGVIVNRTGGGARIYSVATMEDAAAIAGLLNSLHAADPGTGSST